LPLTKVVVAHNVFNFKLSKALEQRSSTRINHWAQAYTKQANKETKNNAPIKSKLLKEHTKG
jgi:hypothetical protein